MKYRAFLSYSRQDDQVADWLHRRLDKFKTPKPLIGVQGSLGDVPSKLHPVYRDRTDASGGGSLAARIEEALQNSRTLIVLCSPAAAASRWVDQEVRFFLGHADKSRIFPVIAPHLSDSSNYEEEFFPPSLRGHDLTAVDLREITVANGQVVGDGKSVGRLKLIAGVLGLPLDQLVRRERRRQRRTVFALSVVAVVFSLLLAGTISALLWANSTNQKLQDAFVRVGTSVEDRIDRLESRQINGEVSVRDAKLEIEIASEIANAGFRLAPANARLKIQEAKLKTRLAEFLPSVGDHQGASIAANEAVSIIEGLKGEIGENTYRNNLHSALWYLADIQRKSGDFDEAIKSLDRMETLALAALNRRPEDADAERNLVIINWQYASIFESVGKLDDARRRLKTAIDISNKLLANEDTDPLLIADLASYYFLDARLARSQQLNDEAAASYKLAIASGRRYLERYPEDNRIQFEFATSLSGYVKFALSIGDLDQANKIQNEVLDVVQRLLQDDPDNVEYQSLKSFAQVDLGKIYFQKKEFDKSIEVLTSAKQEIKSIAAADIDRLVYIRMVYGVDVELSRPLVYSGKLNEALANLESALEQISVLIPQHPGNDTLIQDLTSIHFETATAYYLYNKDPEACEKFKDARHASQSMANEQMRLELLEHIETYINETCEK